MSTMEQPGNEQDSDVADQTATEEQEAVVNQDDAETTDPDSQEQTGDEEEADIEIDGKTFTMPKNAAEKLKSERMFHADYTRKTQEVAEERRTLAAEREQHQKVIEDTKALNAELVKVAAIDNQLAEYKKLDWQKLAEDDPVMAQKLSLQRQQLEEVRNEAQQVVAQKQEQRALAEQQETAKQLQEAEAYLQQHINGWSQERANQINDYARSSGIAMDPAMARAIIKNPALFVLMDKAQKFDQLAAKQGGKPQPQPAAKPVTRISSSRPAAKVDPSKMGTDDWMKQRNAQLRKQR